LNGEKISYKLTVGSNDLMSASADGTLIFPKDKEAILTLNTSLKGYKGSIEFTMKEKK